MANNPASRVSEPLTAKVSRAEIDVGLRRYLLSVYNYMASGLALTGVVAYAAAETGFYASLVKTPLLFWGVALAPLALVFLLSFRIDKMSLGAAQAAFLAYAGLSLAGIFLVYTGTSIARTFFITGAQDPSLAKTLPRKSSRLFQIQFGSKLGQALQRTKRRTRGILAAVSVFGIPRRGASPVACRHVPGTLRLSCRAFRVTIALPGNSSYLRPSGEPAQPAEREQELRKKNLR